MAPAVPLYERFVYGTTNVDGSTADGLEAVFARPITVEHATRELEKAAARGGATVRYVNPAKPMKHE